MKSVVRADAQSAECLVFTFKEGALSALGHDLKIRVGRFDLAIDEQEGAVSATFDPTSLQVVCAVRDGAERPEALSERDRRQIEDAIRDEVLDARRHPEIRFSSTSVTREEGGYRVDGELTLLGRRRNITFQTREEAGRQVAEVRLHQPDFGIRPYSAMLGTLKVKPGVHVRVAMKLPPT
ncbi:MAG: YceI family protein [Myxococcales bacterium]|nr:YceI family protein [Myxococcales bacterium]